MQVFLWMNIGTLIAGACAGTIGSQYRPFALAGSFRRHFAQVACKGVPVSICTSSDESTDTNIFDNPIFEWEELAKKLTGVAVSARGKGFLAPLVKMQASGIVGSMQSAAELFRLLAESAEDGEETAMEAQAGNWTEAAVAWKSAAEATEQATKTEWTAAGAKAMVTATLETAKLAGAQDSIAVADEWFKAGSMWTNCAEYLEKWEKEQALAAVASLDFVGAISLTLAGLLVGSVVCLFMVRCSAFSNYRRARIAAGYAPLLFENT